MILTLIVLIVGMSLLILFQDQLFGEEDEYIDILDLFKEDVEIYLKDRIYLFEKQKDIVIYMSVPRADILANTILNDSDLFTKEESKEIADEICENCSDEIIGVIFSVISEIREEIENV